MEVIKVVGYYKEGLNLQLEPHALGSVYIQSKYGR